ENEPMTSTTTCVCPALLKMLICPPAPTLARTRLAIVKPAVKLWLEASGCCSPVGHTVRNSDDVGWSTVTFPAKPVTPGEGTQNLALTGTLIVWLGPTGIPAPSRVSSTRPGVTAVNLPPPVGGDAVDAPTDCDTD